MSFNFFFFEMKKYNKNKLPISHSLKPDDQEKLDQMNNVYSNAKNLSQSVSSRDIAKILIDSEEYKNIRTLQKRSNHKFKEDYAELLKEQKKYASLQNDFEIKEKLFNQIAKEIKQIKEKLTGWEKEISRLEISLERAFWPWNERALQVSYQSEWKIVLKSDGTIDFYWDDGELFGQWATIFIVDDTKLELSRSDLNRTAAEKWLHLFQVKDAKKVWEKFFKILQSWDADIKNVVQWLFGNIRDRNFRPKDMDYRLNYTNSELWKGGYLSWSYSSGWMVNVHTERDDREIRMVLGFKKLWKI